MPESFRRRQIIVGQQRAYSPIPRQQAFATGENTTLTSDMIFPLTPLKNSIIIGVIGISGVGQGMNTFNQSAGTGGFPCTLVEQGGASQASPIAASMDFCTGQVTVDLNPALTYGFCGRCGQVTAGIAAWIAEYPALTVPTTDRLFAGLVDSGIFFSVQDSLTGGFLDLIIAAVMAVAPCEFQPGDGFTLEATMQSATGNIAMMVSDRGFNVMAPFAGTAHLSPTQYSQYCLGAFRSASGFL